MQDYRKLLVWRRAHELILDVRNSSRMFPRSGYAGLKSQLTTAAESIAFNIVEGCGASTRKEFARFLDISIKSANETEYQLLLARDYSVMNTAHWQQHSGEVVAIRKMLCTLRNRVLAADRDDN